MLDDQFVTIGAHVTDYFFIIQFCGRLQDRFVLRHSHNKYMHVIAPWISPGEDDIIFYKFLLGYYSKLKAAANDLVGEQLGFRSDPTTWINRESVPYSGFRYVDYRSAEVFLTERTVDAAAKAKDDMVAGTLDEPEDYDAQIVSEYINMFFPEEAEFESEPAHIKKRSLPCHSTTRKVKPRVFFHDEY